MRPNFKKMELIPAIVQDYQTKEVLMLAYVNEEAYDKMLEINQTVFYSRSRKKLWHKGEESGHFQDIKGIYLDCDLDTLLIYVKQTGVACHTGAYSCFFNEVKSYDTRNIFSELEKTIEDRKIHPVEKSYTNYLLNEGVDMIFDTMVKDIIIEDGVAKGVVTDKGETYTADEIVAAVGREGSEWLSGICRKYDIETQVGTVDVGVRVEVRDEIMEELNKSLYEAKLVYYTPTFDDKVRVFCSNPSGEVATEYYENGLAVVNGHAYKADEYKTNNTNFALLVSKNFTKPFKEPIQYGKHIAQLSNMLCDGKILVQRFGDFVRGRRTTEERLVRNNITPTLKDAVPGDLSLVFPYRIMKDIEEMIYALDEVTPGMASDETLLYGVEVKFYSNKILTNKDFETNIKGLRAIGDGASVTRGLQQASANGLSVAKSILNK